MSDVAQAGLDSGEVSRSGADTRAGTAADTAAAGDSAAAGPAVAGPAAEDSATEDSAAEDAEDGAGLNAADEADKAAPERRSHRSPAGPGMRRPVLILSVAFAVLVVALAAIAVKLGLSLSAQQRQRDDQQAVLHAARQAAADLMTLSYASAASDLNRLQGIATGSFYSQVNANRKQLINEAVSAHAVSTANVLGAGLVGGQVSGNTATVIVVVDSTVTSKNAPNGVVNHYRETITLTRTGGRWLASQVDFATPSGGQ